MNKFIFFIHVHKCAGTAIVDLFSQQDSIKMSAGWKWRNGIPKYFQELKPITDYGEFDDKYNKAKIDEFMSRMSKNGVNFVATEWAIPKMENLPFGPKNYYFTVLRDPFERYLSNYYFDKQRGYRVVDSIYDYPDGRMTREPDYYTRLFSSHLERDPSPTTESDYKRAIALLNKLDAVIIQEDSRTFDLLKQLDVDTSLLRRKNTTKQKERSYPDGFREYFMEKARYDYMLYEEAKKIAARQLETMESNGKKVAKKRWLGKLFEMSKH